MELRHLRYFVAVAEERSFVHAARRLHVAQPALSKQIRDLENELGGPLFERLPRGVRLTAPGEAFLVEARATLQRAAQALERARETMQLRAASLRIAHGELYAYAASIGNLLAAFREAHPNVQLQVSSQSDAETERALRERRVDVGCVFITDPSPSGFEAHLLLDTSATGVLLPARHPLAASPAVHLADLRGLPWLGATPERWPGVEKALEAALRSRGLVPLAGGRERPAVDPFINLVAADSWALASEVVGAPYSTGSTPIAYRPIVEPAIPAWLALVWPRPASPAIQDLVGVARGLKLCAA